MLYHIELFEYTLIRILFTIYLTFGIQRHRFFFICFFFVDKIFVLIGFFVRKIKSISFNVNSFFTFEKVSVLAYQFYHFPEFYLFVFYQFLLFFEFILVWNYQISCNFDKNSVFLRLIVHQFLENLSKSISSGYISLTGFLQVISFLSC